MIISAQGVSTNPKFIILSPCRQSYGGTIALHALCRVLLDLGYEAAIYYTDAINFDQDSRFVRCLKHLRFLCKDTIKLVLVSIFGTNWARKKKYLVGYVDLAVQGCARSLFPSVDDSTIVVYPEGVTGNVLRAHNCVHWLLYHNNYSRQAKKAFSGDLFYCYRKVFNDEELNPEERILYTPYFNLNLYRRTNYGRREGVCYIIRKGLGRKDLPCEFDGIVIDDLPEVEKVQVFNQCEICISYDTQTAYSSIAAMCGCVSVVVPESGKSYKDYRSRDEGKPPGIAYGFDDAELEFAVRTADLVRPSYERLNEITLSSVRNFVEECTRYFYNRDDNERSFED